MITSQFTKDLDDSNYIIFGAGPVALACAKTLSELNLRYIIMSIDDHQGIENKLNYGKNLNLDEKYIGGIGGTARLWGGQCGFFNFSDYENWENFELGVDFDQSNFAKAIIQCSNYIGIDPLALKNSSTSKTELKIARTIYPSNIEIKNIFKEIIYEDKIYYRKLIECYLETEDNHVIVFENKEELVIPKTKNVIFALGAVGNLNLYRKSIFTKHLIKSKIGVLDHLSFYPLRFKGTNNFPKFPLDEYINKNKFKNKYYFSNHYSPDKDGPTFLQQGIAEFHPLYIWEGQSKISFLINLSKRITNFIFKKLKLPISVKPEQFSVFMQIEQSIGSQRYVEINEYKGISISDQDIDFIHLFIRNLKEFFIQEDIEILEEEKIDKKSIPSLFQAFHPSSVFNFPFKGRGLPLVNFEGRPVGSTNLNFVGSCCFPTPGWINPTLMAMSHASYVTRRLAREKKL